METTRLLGFLKLIRPHNVVVAVLNGLVGVVTASWLLHVRIPSEPVVAALAAIAFVSAAGYAINDYFDADIDAVSKPYRPIPSGAVKPYEAYVLSLLLFVMGVAVAAGAGLANLVYAAVVALLLYIYPSKLKRRRALTGHLVVAVTGASTITFAGIAVTPWNPLRGFLASLIPAAYAFTLILAREFVKALEDFEGDAARGAATIATVYGVDRARLTASLLLALVAAAAPLPYLLAGYGILYIVFASMVALLCIHSILLVEKGKYSRARTELKVAFALGGLAFLLDPLIHVTV